MAPYKPHLLLFTTLGNHLLLNLALLGLTHNPQNEADWTLKVFESQIRKKPTLVLVSSRFQFLQPGFGAGGLLGLQPQLYSMEVLQDLPLRRGGTQLRAMGKTGPRAVRLRGSCVRDPSVGGQALPTCSWGCPASWAQPRAFWKHSASTS